MAANKTATYAATATLVASTGYVINLTGKLGNTVELVHHGDVSTVVYYQLKDTEAELEAFVVAASEIGVLGVGERLTVPAPRGSSTWIRLLSAAAPTVSVVGRD